MAKKENKGRLGKRLWNSITEPLPDDDSQANEQIPLAYDLKDSAAAKSATEESAATIDVDQAQAETSTAAAPVSKSVIDPDLDRHPQSVAASAAAIDDTKPSSAATTVTSATNQQPKSTPTSATTHHEQPVISVQAIEKARTNNDAQPELPLSREELYGDQQPNAGSAAPRTDRTTDDSETMSRMARHGETPVSAAATNDENPHLKKKAKANNNKPHQKPQRRRRNRRLMLLGVVILIVAAVGSMYMWTNAKTTQSQARSNAEAQVKKIYTADKSDLRASASTTKLAQLQTAIDDLKASSEKTSLQQQHDTAVKMLKVRTTYQGLYNEDKLIKVGVTTATITTANNQLKATDLATSKADFTTKYQEKLSVTGKTVKAVQGYHRDFKDLYTKKDKLKSSVSTSRVDKVMKHLKAYQSKSQLARNDYARLKADRKKLAKSEAAAAAAESSRQTSIANESSSSSSYSEPSLSSSSSEESSSEESSSSDTSSSYSAYSTTTDSTTTNDNDTATSSADSSSYYSADSSSSNASSDNSSSSDTTSTTTDGYSFSTTY
ncbi:hypothetical protein C5Z25_04350 [Lactobacillus sp. CBA3605]|uniref:hypothetical protein n=1 Tax=Lactobacillus sp. CBA3605 TaxID=2099788 RepID=UPI000CFD6B57|nr:hypothetical protein [Lactobacillus sp. CBA3605]AVK61038.1 hypothetical protein C5Z25_04350 [Lactobacillus sp. CBA3605]